jgi:hypothetical protein
VFGFLLRGALRGSGEPSARHWIDWRLPGKGSGHGGRALAVVACHGEVAGAMGWL